MEAGTKRTGTTVQRHCTNTFIKINLPETPSFSAILFHCCAVTVLSLCCLCDASQIQGVIETSVIRVSISIFPERFKWEKVTVNPPRFGPRLLALLPALVRVQYGHIKTSRLGSPAPARRQWGRGIHTAKLKYAILARYRPMCIFHLHILGDGSVTITEKSMHKKLICKKRTP